MKAFLVWHDVRFRKVHDLDELGKQRLQADASLAGLVEQARSLTVYASRFRYPGVREPALEEATAASGLARHVLEAVLIRLPAEVRL